MNKLGYLIAAGLISLLPACSGGSGGSDDGSGFDPRLPRDPGDSLVNDIPTLPHPGGRTSPPPPPPPPNGGGNGNVPTNVYRPGNTGGPTGGAPRTEVPGHVGPRTGPNTPPGGGNPTPPSHRVPTGTIVPPPGGAGTGRDIPRTTSPGGDDSTTPTPGGPTTPPVHQYPHAPIPGGFEVPPAPRTEFPELPGGGTGDEPRVPPSGGDGPQTGFPEHPGSDDNGGGGGTEPVPEPSTWVLFGLGAILCALLARTRTNVANTIAIVERRR